MVPLAEFQTLLANADYQKIAPMAEFQKLVEMGDLAKALPTAIE
jgi:hypothetical protein